MDSLSAIAGFAVGFGVSALVFMRAILRKLGELVEQLEALHVDNIETARTLKAEDKRRVRHVTEEGPAL